MESLHLNRGIVKLDRSYAELLLHADSTIGEWTTGDVDDQPAEHWPEWTDDWHFEPTDEDVRWWAENSPANAADFDAEGGLTEEEERAKFERWLAGLAPSDDELALRDRTDCGFGHHA